MSSPLRSEPELLAGPVLRVQAGTRTLEPAVHEAACLTRQESEPSAAHICSSGRNLSGSMYSLAHRSISVKRSRAHSGSRSDAGASEDEELPQAVRDEEKGYPAFRRWLTGENADASECVERRGQRNHHGRMCIGPPMRPHAAQNANRKVR